MKIITTSELQQKIGMITGDIHNTAFVITNHGKGKMVLLPYYEGCDEVIEDYMEDYEIFINREKLIKELDASARSGDSDLVI